MSNGTAITVIERSANEVWAAVTAIARMGEWSPECVACRWVAGASGPAIGATFEGDNELRVAGLAIKKWTTTSKVTGCDPGRLFEFKAENYTTWRYELEPTGSGTTVTESFEYDPRGFLGFVGDTVMRRPSTMVKGMERTLARLKAALENA